MTRSFRDIGAFIKHLEAMPAEIAKAEAIGVLDAGEMLLKEVRKEIGTYQDENTGPFAPWAELADRTKDERVRNQYSENDPGFASGEMLRSYGVRAEGRHASIGSDDPHALWFEFGTTRDGQAFHQPPRSVLGLAAFRHGEEAAHIVGRAVVRVVEGKPVPNRVEDMSGSE